MGSLCSSCCGNRDDDIFESSHSNDKTNLLGSPVGEPTHQNPIQKSLSGDMGDQQEKLNRILHKTANSYIDVPALNSPVEQPIDKARNYESKILAPLSKKHLTEKSLLLQDTPHLEKTLSDEPITERERKLMTDANKSILDALQSIQVESSESLVIPFNTPKSNP